MIFIKKFFISIIKLIRTFKKDNVNLIKNTSWLTINQIVVVFLGVLLSIIFARFTTQEVFGEYNFLLSIFTVLSIISIPGLNTSMLRSISRGMDGVYVKSVKLSFIWSLLGIPLLILIASYYYYFSNQVLGIIIFFSAFIFPFLYAPNNWIGLLQGKKRFDIFAKYSIIQTTVRTFTIISAILLGSGNIFLIFISYILTSGITNIIFYFKSKTFLKNNDEEEGWKKSGYKLTFNDFVNLSYDYLDKILIGIFLGPSELAIYAIAVSLVSAIKYSIIQIMKVFYPHVFTIKKEKMKSNLKKIIFPVIIFNILFLLVINFLIPSVMIFLYSDKYVSSIFYAQLYTLTILPSLLLILLDLPLIALSEENAILKFRILGLTIVLILYFILIPSIGIIGAILSSLIYYLTLIFCEFIYFKSRNIT